MADDDLNDGTIRAISKAEVHVHLEGCFSAADLAAKARHYGEPLPRSVDELFRFSGFDDFLDFLSWSCGLLRTADDVARAAYSYAERAAASGVVCADLIVNPTHWADWRTNLGGLIGALDRGLADAEQDGLTTVGLCISIFRLQTAEEAGQLVDELIRLRHPRVVGLSIDGNEALSGRTGSRFADAFASAGRAGLKRTVHAGETSGPEGVRDALDLLGADRIDHGIRAIEDPSLVARLADSGVSLGICPTSNVTLRIVASLHEHPIELLRQAGVRVTVNSDDPGLLGIDLVGEYRRLVDTFGWSEEVVNAVAGTSLDVCFSNRGSTPTSVVVS